MCGWIGKIAGVNLGTNTITNIPTRSYAEKHLGGRGIGTRLYWEISDLHNKAFDPANPLIFITGPLVAFGAGAATIMSVAGKSPAAFPADDYPREYLFEEPISGPPESPEVMVPGPGESVVNITGRKLIEKSTCKCCKSTIGFEAGMKIPAFLYTRL